MNYAAAVFGRISSCNRFPFFSRPIAWLLATAVALLFGCASGKNAHDPLAKYSAAELQQDASVLWSTFQQCHPSLYWYTPKDSVDQAFVQLQSSLKDSMNELDFRNLVSRAVASLRCGHTSVRSSSSSAKLRQAMRLPMFPLQVKTWNGDSMVVLANAFRGDSILVRGTSIHSINGLAVRIITDSIAQFISGDGYHNNFRYQLISNNFPAWYRIIFGVSSKYELDITTVQGIRRQVSIGNFDPHLLDSLNRARAQKREPAPSLTHQAKLEQDRKLSIDTFHNLAIMELNTFSKAQLPSFFKSTFQTLRDNHIPNLVIELRENGGGNILNSTRLARYLTDHKFKVADTVAAVSLKYPYPQYVKNGWIYRLQAWFVTRKRADGRLHYAMYERKYFKPYKNLHYDGHVYIITGGFTFSASTLFISPLAGQKNITLVGEETGGGAYGNTAVNVPDLVLPNTRLKVRLPLYRIVVNKNLPHDGSGILPDVPVPPASRNLARRIDPKMEKVYELIKAASSKPDAAATR